MRAWIATLLLAGVGIGMAAAAAPVGVISVVEPAQSKFEFSLQTR